MRYPQVIDPATQPKQSYPVLPEKQFRLSDGSYDTLLFQKPFNNAAMPLEYENNKAPPSYKTDVGSSKIRVYSDENKFVGFVDNYVAHPIDPAYQAVVKSLEYNEPTYDRKASAIAESMSYKPLGAGADDEAMNNLRNKLRFLGASESDIEEAIRMEKKKRLENAINTQLTPQQQEAMIMENMVSSSTQTDTTPNVQQEIVNNLNGFAEPAYTPAPSKVLRSPNDPTGILSNFERGLYSGKTLQINIPKTSIPPSVRQNPQNYMIKSLSKRLLLEDKPRPIKVEMGTQTEGGYIPGVLDAPPYPLLSMPSDSRSKNDKATQMSVRELEKNKINFQGNLQGDFKKAFLKQGKPFTHVSK